MESHYSLFLNNLHQDHPEWSTEALAFICRGIEFFNNTTSHQNDLSFEDLINALCLHSLNEYGPLALYTLNRLNFHKTLDFLQVINLLTERKIITGIDKIDQKNKKLDESLHTKFPDKTLPEPHLWPKIKKVDKFQFFR